MRNRALFPALFACFASIASAQSNDGWRKLGEALGGGASDARHRGQMRALRDQAQILELRSLQYEEQRRGAEKYWRSRLQAVWLGYGLPAYEAQTLANSYALDFDKQMAVGARVKREGWQQGAQSAVEAYKAYNLQLANELLVAAMAIQGLESSPPQEPGEANPPMR